MKLSEAIRLGSLLDPQGFGQRVSYDKGGVQHTCALEAAHRAGFDIIAWFRYSFLELENTNCPICQWVPPLQIGLVPHLNDQHRWTREAIADFLDTLSSQPEQRHPDRPLHESLVAVGV